MVRRARSSFDSVQPLLLAFFLLAQGAAADATWVTFQLGTPGICAKIQSLRTPHRSRCAELPATGFPAALPDAAPGAPQLTATRLFTAAALPRHDDADAADKSSRAPPGLL